MTKRGSRVEGKLFENENKTKSLLKYEGRSFFSKRFSRGQKLHDNRTDAERGVMISHGSEVGTVLNATVNTGVSVQTPMCRLDVKCVVWSIGSVASEHRECRLDVGGTQNSASLQTPYRANCHKLKK